MIYLFVKGSPKSAKRAANRHGVQARSCELVQSRGPRNQESKCHAACSRDQVNAVVRWYGSPDSSVKPGRGYAPGALLFYNANACEGLSGRKRKRKRRR